MLGEYVGESVIQFYEDMVASMYHMVAMKILVIANPADSAKFADLTFLSFLSCVCFAVISASQQTR